MNRKNHGVGTGAGSSYETYIKEKINDPRVWRAVYGGYLGKSWNETSVECDDDWYFVTKTVVHCLAENVSPKTKYQVPNRIASGDAAQGYTLEDIQRRGKKILDEAEKLYDYAVNGTDDYRVATISLEKSGNTYTSGNNVIQKFNLKTNKELASYDVSLIGFPVGASYSKDGNILSVIIPKANIKEDIDGLIRVTNARIKTCPAFYGESYNEEYQDYVLVSDPFEKANTSAEFSLETDTAQLEILKIDDETKQVVPNTTFEIKKDNKLIKTVETGSDGKAVLKDLYPGIYQIKETKANTNYESNSKIQTVELKYGETTKITISNNHKTGSLRIYKVDADDEKLPIEGVKFEITDSIGKKKTIETNKEGIAYIDNIRTGGITIKEIETNEIYELPDETYKLEIQYNKTSEITIKNEKLKGKVEVYKKDAEDNKIMLKDIEFQVINSENKVVDTIKTNEKGVAETTNLPIGHYKLKETKTDDYHVLDDKLISVEVKANKISRLNITNERIKGKIKIVKTSEDDNFINGEKAGTPIANVKFEVYDVDCKLVDTIITNEHGIATTKELDKGKYVIKEVEAGKWYLLNENEFATEISKNDEIVEINITNESEEPNVDIEKEGIIQTTANEEIRYDFHIKNTGNTKLNNYTWYDYLPTEYVRITKLITGTYNQDLNYSIYYKTNKNDYRLLKDNLNTQINNYIDFANLKLEKDEYITEFKVDFGTVDIGFESVISPYIFVKINSDVNNDDKFTNKTRVEGYNDTYLVYDEDKHTTQIYEKELKVKKLPRTGY